MFDVCNLHDECIVIYDSLTFKCPICEELNELTKELNKANGEDD